MTMNENFRQFGIDDASNSQPCIPEFYTVNHDQMAEYIDGYRWVLPDTLTGYDWADELLLTSEDELEEVPGMAELEFAI